MEIPPQSARRSKSHPSRGGWIEMLISAPAEAPATRPTPHGVGGLKLIYRVNSGGTKASHPSRGGWIEMVMPPPKSVRLLVPPLTGWVD